MNLKHNIFTTFVIIIIISGILIYTEYLVRSFKKEEEKKVALWSKAMQEAALIYNDNTYLDVDPCSNQHDEIRNFVFSIINDNENIPAILSYKDDESIISAKNCKKYSFLFFSWGGDLDSSQEKDLQKLRKELKSMKTYNYTPIQLENYGGKGIDAEVYYRESELLNRLRYFPFFILTVFGGVVLVGYFSFRNAKVAQQNKVWTGMARETAHQIGTPLSSLMGWLEHLKQNKSPVHLTKEIEKDLSRLNTIATRFSKIGSLPKLEKLNLVPILKDSIQYINKRAPNSVSFNLETEKSSVELMLNKDLFEWVIENTLKNAIDAISKKGNIVLKIKENEKTVFVDLVDNGKGIKRSMYSKIFEPGFTSKKRGWGLGLTLVKRIIEDYHQGQVKVVSSIPYKETIIRIVLKK